MSEKDEAGHFLYLNVSHDYLHVTLQGREGVARSPLCSLCLFLCVLFLFLFRGLLMRAAGILTHGISLCCYCLCLRLSRPQASQYHATLGILLTRIYFIGNMVCLWTEEGSSGVLALRSVVGCD